MARTIYGDLRKGDRVRFAGTTYVVESVSPTPAFDVVAIVFANTNAGRPYTYFRTESVELAEPAEPARPSAAEVLARAILIGGGEDEETDHLEILEAIRPILTPEHFTAVAESMDVCPIHLCDIEICIDDEADCQKTEG